MSAAVGCAGEPPLISAIMPFGDPARINLARGAVSRFAEQTYQNKQLVIANGCGTPVLLRPTVRVKEVRVSGTRQTVGALRNAALDAADGSWVLHWDDDDLFDASYIAYHAGARNEGQATLLTNQVRFNFRESAIRMLFRPEGIAATVFYPATAARFQQADRGEVEAFWIEHWALRTKILLNYRYPSNCLSVAVYHGKNVLPVEEFMEGFCGSIHEGRCALQPGEMERVRAILATANIFVGWRPLPVEDAAE